MLCAEAPGWCSEPARGAPDGVAPAAPDGVAHIAPDGSGSGSR